MFSFQYPIIKYDCPVCFDILLPPIFQCFEGHLLCKNCIEKLESKCPICRGDLPAKKIKALEVEKIVRRNPFACKFRKFGCKVVMTLDPIKEHELDCQFSSQANFCKYLGLNCKKRLPFQDLASHLTSKHEITIGTLKYDLGKEIELSQDLKRDGRFVAPSPDSFLLPTYFIQTEEALFFLKTEWTQRYSVRWMVFVIGRGDVSSKFTASITLHSLRVPGNSIKWKGNVFGVQAKSKDVRSECLTLHSDTLCPTYMQEMETGDFHWKLRLKITRKTEASQVLFKIVLLYVLAIIMLYSLICSCFKMIMN